jgi:hypothetical protein
MDGCRPAALLLVCAAAGCSLISGVSSLKVDLVPPSSLDGSVDGAGDAASGAFGIALDPDRIASDVNVTVDVMVNATRSPKTKDAIVVTVDGLPQNVTVESLSIAPGESAGKLSFHIGAASGAANLVVRAVADDEAATAPLPLVVTPSLYVAATIGSGSYTVPPNVKQIDVRAWAGGGGGGGTADKALGGSGGGGGFARATLDVTPGEALDYFIGDGGDPGKSALTEGGGGGGMTTLSRGTTTLLVAGAGGGGGGARSGDIAGAAGGAGGGAVGQDGVSSGAAFPDEHGLGGTQTAGGRGGLGGKGVCDKCTGTAGRGGPAVSNAGPIGGGGAGGIPAGGAGGSDGSPTSYGGGGGGSGWFGGGGAEAGHSGDPVAGSGGGGGSSYAVMGAVMPNLVSGSFASAANSGDAYYASAAGAGGVAATKGKPGRLVIIPQ